MSNVGSEGLSRRVRVLRASWLLVIAVLGAYVAWPAPAYGAAAIRINAGGPAQTVDGASWTGCTAMTACGGYVTGGNAWSENPSSITGIVSPDSQTIEKSEWTGGATSGTPWGATAFSFAVPVSGSATYSVKLHFTETNKSTVGARVFDVKLNGATVLSNFDIFKEAGGANRTIVRSFSAPAVNGKVTLDFVRKTENAKVSAIEILGEGSVPTTTTVLPTTTSTTTAPTTTTGAPTTVPAPTTTAAPSATTTTGVPTTGGTTLSWSTIAPSPQEAVEATGGVANGKLYTFGGYVNSVWSPVAKSYVYDPGANTWTQIADVPRGITHSANVVDGNSFIVAGGYTNNGSGQTFAINNVWRYDTLANTWSSLPSLPAARGSGAMAKVGNVVHFLGGVDVNRVEKSEHWTLDLANINAGWKVAAPFPYPRTHFPAVAVGTSIYTVGGLVGVDAKSTELDGVYRYDTVMNTWTKMASLPLPLSHISDATVLYQGKIWTFGGEPHFGQESKNVYVYDPATNVWSSSTPLPSWRFSGVAGNINGTFYYATGESGSNAAYKATIK